MKLQYYYSLTSLTNVKYEVLSYPLDSIKSMMAQIRESIIRGGTVINEEINENENISWPISNLIQLKEENIFKDPKVQSNEVSSNNTIVTTLNIKLKLIHYL